MTDKEIQQMFDEVAEKVGPLQQTDEEMRAEAHKLVDENDCFILSAGSKGKDEVTGMYFLRKDLKEEMTEEEMFTLIMHIVTTLVSHKPHLFKDALDLIAKKYLDAMMNDPETKRLMDMLSKKLNPDGDDPADNDERNTP